MTGASGNRRHLLVEPVKVWLGLIVLLAISTGSAFVPLGAANTAVNLLIAAAMVLLLVTFLMDLRSSTLFLRIVSGAGLFWTVFMFALTFVDYATRH